MKRIVQQTLALGAALLLGAGAVLVLGASSPPGNPLSQLGPEARERRQFEGRPAEQLRAGSYTYVRLVDDAGQGRWVVTMGRGVGGAARVQARPSSRPRRRAQERSASTMQRGDSLPKKTPGVSIWPLTSSTLKPASWSTLPSSWRP